MTEIGELAITLGTAALSFLGGKKLAASRVDHTNALAMRALSESWDIVTKQLRQQTAACHEEHEITKKKLAALEARLAAMEATK